MDEPLQLKFVTVISAVPDTRGSLKGMFCEQLQAKSEQVLQQIHSIGWNAGNISPPSVLFYKCDYVFNISNARLAHINNVTKKQAAAG